MNQPVPTFTDWLAATPASIVIQDVSWIIPSVQTVHILGIAIVMSSALVIDLRILGVMQDTQPLHAIARRFLPWIWVTLVVLLLSGGVLIVGEPGRSLSNPAFIAKMSMLALAVTLTLLLQFGLRRDAYYWEMSAARRIFAKSLATLSLVLWTAIVYAGRWIAYVSVDS